jgi:TusE/DsrC/DsvC family sulfur relay protein
MSTDTIAGYEVEFDDAGYMTDPSQWNEEIATELADRNRITLTEKHWLVVRFCRAHAAEHGESPGVRHITRNVEVTMREMYELFPKGPGKLAALIAGLSKPDSCI